MGDTYRDPVDHLRTTRPLAGESLIDVLHWPGYLMVVAGLVAVCGSLAAFGTGHQDEGMTAGVTAIVVTLAGLVWLAVEHRRVRRIFNRWYLDHPDVARQSPDS
ncbi:protein UsfY [Mycobacterium sp. Aquia_213]|uniref:protein UsfY n=1 Tax=Mycobacterium sp. Aquia_213 TaxID=2991728 RepID=UPI002270740A|nr:protein UsfY [Mycobacterium sp. Aquia_213]WAC90555.1 protein UsfY [Mycobacterium sp. Aquia_213]